MIDLTGYRVLVTGGSRGIGAACCRLFAKAGATVMVQYMASGARAQHLLQALADFGEAGGGFLSFSCAEPDERLQQALEFLPKAIANTGRVQAYLEKHPKHRLAKPYPQP